MVCTSKAIGSRLLMVASMWQMVASRRILLRAVPFAGLMAMVVGGCFNPSVRECAVSCSASTPCPSGASCLSDGFCHADPTDSLCSASPDAAPLDAAPACGNGIIELGLGEVCDDGNAMPADGCDATCDEEPGFVCVDQPSECRAVPTSPGELVITELQVNPNGPDLNKEWIEIHNPTANDFDLLGLSLSDEGGEIFNIAASLVLPAQGYVVLGQSSNLDLNGGVAVDLAYNAFLMANNADEVIISNGDIVIDEVAILNSPQGPSRSLSADKTDHLENDDRANFCDGVDSYGTNGDLGTPGAANPLCP